MEGKKARSPFDNSVVDAFFTNPDTGDRCHSYSFKNIQILMCAILNIPVNPFSTIIKIDYINRLCNLLSTGLYEYAPVLWIIPGTRQEEALYYYMASVEAKKTSLVDKIEKNAAVSEILEIANDLLIYLNSSPLNLRYPAKTSSWNRAIGESYDLDKWCYTSYREVIADNSNYSINIDIFVYNSTNSCNIPVGFNCYYIISKKDNYLIHQIKELKKNFLLTPDIDVIRKDYPYELPDKTVKTANILRSSSNLFENKSGMTDNAIPVKYYNTTASAWDIL